MQKKENREGIFDISNSKISKHAWEEFIKDLGISDVIEANQTIKEILKTAQRLARKHWKVRYRSQGWIIITDERGKKPRIITMYRRRTRKKLLH